MEDKTVGNLEYMCEGCKKANMETYRCEVYAAPPPYYLKHKCCPFNREEKVKPKRKVRVGQQKQKRRFR
jgi:hypothetical protein